jgi:hypothetical protein
MIDFSSSDILLITLSDLYRVGGGGLLLVLCLSLSAVSGTPLDQHNKEEFMVSSQAVFPFYEIRFSSVADPGCLSRMRLFSIPDPGSEFFHPGSRIRFKEFKCFNQKIVSKL